MNLQTRALVAAATALLVSPACQAMGETSARVELSTACHQIRRGDETALPVLIESTASILSDMDDASLSGTPEWEIASLALEGVEA